jgi:hypothetical protein
MTDKSHSTPIMTKHILLAAVTCALALAPNLLAEEGGSGHYSPGQTSSFIDEMPGYPALAVVNYFTYYNGSVGGGRSLPLGGNVAANAKADVYVDTVGVFYETPVRLLGGNYAPGLAIPFGTMTVDGDITATGPRGRERTGKVSDTSSGLADLTVYPFILAWTNGPDLKYDVRLGVYAPSGAYEKGALANLGKNFWTFEPTVSFSWLSSKIGTEVTLFTGMDFNTMNEATDYQTGIEFHLDGTVAQHLPLFGGFIGVGANGFVYQQITGDSGSGAVLGPFEGRTIGVGPLLSYLHKIGKTTLAAELKWLPELDVQNRMQGDWIWFKLALVF